MGQTRTLQTGSTHGYTLTELLVVLAIIGVISVSLPLGYRAAVPSARLEHAAGEAVTLLRDAREFSVSRQIETRVFINQARTRLVSSFGADVVSLPQGIHVRYRPEFEMVASENPGITFYPDGGSTGGEFVLEGESRSRRISVHWLFGHVSRINE